MALPNYITNGQTPDATKLMANFEYLLSLIKTDYTLAEIKALAEASPANKFIAFPTDLNAVLVYVGDASAANTENGFITLSSW